MQYLLDIGVGEQVAKWGWVVYLQRIDKVGRFRCSELDETDALGVAVKSVRFEVEGDLRPSSRPLDNLGESRLGGYDLCGFGSGTLHPS